MEGIFQNDASLQITGDLKTPGFVFAPFEANGDKILLTGEYLQAQTHAIQNEKKEKKIEFSDEGKDFHLKLVEDAISRIEKGKLKKVVLSRCIHRSTQKHPEHIFTSLLVKYPSAFRFWWYHPKVGMWFGATPEQLLKFQNGLVCTTSLAGTLPVVKNEKPDWTIKEREEQQMVTDYILHNLKGKVANLSVSGPNTYMAGKLWHLRSMVVGELNPFDDLVTIVKSLHPTPAICGMPRMEALEFILQHEGYNREFYTGYLGPIHLGKKKNIDLFVNLRCFKYSPGNAQIFVGGGITADSDPEKEWLETQYKSGTILEVL